MTKRSCVVLVLTLFLVVSCNDSSLECHICGDFEVANFSKSELNSTGNETVSIRRNLSLNKYGGADYYTIWSWEERNPDAAWTEVVNKKLEVLSNKLSIREDGTWSWSMIADETFQSSPYYGSSNCRVNKYYSENGSWRFLNDDRNHISLQTEITRMESEVTIIDQEGNYMIEKKPKSIMENRNLVNVNRHFQVIKNEQVANQLTLKSVDENLSGNLDHINNSSYSITDGSVMLNLLVESNRAKLVMKLK